ncbi:nuclear transport factor 2 family protein [Actinophytocola sp.]|jgi:uncharacterized protein (TIGR02246 family)|uniref:nuclear transport factor 2 family protein n=1 Tax=Actinophytocola sp. TaxID=1872138 RepID=UPI002EDADCF1
MSTEILDLIQQWASVELDGDVDAYKELFAEDFVGIGPVGFVLNRDQWAGRHVHGLKNHEFTVTDPHVRTYGETAIVEAVEQQRTTAMGRDTSGSFRVGVVVVRQDGRWVIAHIQLSGPLIAPGEMPSFAK